MPGFDRKVTEGIEDVPALDIGFPDHRENLSRKTLTVWAFKVRVLDDGEGCRKAAECRRSFNRVPLSQGNIGDISGRGLASLWCKLSP
jgi:hypothetical protein